MLKWIGVTVLAAAVAEMAFGYVPRPSGTAAGVEEQTTVTSAMPADIVTGEVAEK